MKTDSELKIDVTRELAQDPRLDASAIGVSAHRGVITLNGTVAGWLEKHDAEVAAHRVDGVHDVANDIEIRPCWSAELTDTEIAEAVRAALEIDRAVPDEAIHSTVSDHGAVTLTGKVLTLAQREEAVRCVRDLEGVRCVSNEIVVDTPPIEAGTLRGAIEAALERHVARERDRIHIEIEGDTVLLSGLVDSWRERRAVVGAAKGTPGVRQIDDELLLVAG